jgi:hypothetical protein
MWVRLAVEFDVNIDIIGIYFIFIDFKLSVLQKLKFSFMNKDSVIVECFGIHIEFTAPNKLVEMLTIIKRFFSNIFGHVNTLEIKQDNNVTPRTFGLNFSSVE